MYQSLSKVGTPSLRDLVTPHGLVVRTTHTHTQPKKINKLYHIVTNNSNNKCQCNDDIEDDTIFSDKFSLSRGT